MASIIQLLLFIQVFSLFDSVQAGHPLWEYSSRRNVTDQEITSFTKRWLSIDRGSWGIWQNDAKENIIYYCYADDNAESKLEGHLWAALDIWHSAGLPEEFQIEKVDRSERKAGDKILLINYNEDGVYQASMGLIAESIRKAMNLPVAHLSDKRKDPAVHIAHELGHVWGLAHEHQNKYFWKAPIGEGSDIFRLFCSRLMDYNSVSVGLSNDQINGPNGICTSRDAAARAGFSAASYLPFKKFVAYPQEYAVVTNDMVDWDSIMIYHSIAPVNNEPVFVRADSVGFSQGLVPSQKDVQGIRQLYNFIPTTFESGTLLIHPNNPLHAQFQSFQCS